MVADAGCYVINSSLVDYEYAAAVKVVINYALSKGCIVVATAGNVVLDIDLTPVGFKKSI